MKRNPKILIISGATASGKSTLATKFALSKNGVIINADAIQLYKELPILSAQPSAKDQKEFPHFLYSILKHNQNSSVVKWIELAVDKINQTLTNKQLPIVVGGTGLYISKLIDGINLIPEIDQDLQTEIRQIIHNTPKEVEKELIKILLDLGDNFQEIESLDKQRLARRLEVLKQTNKTLSWWQKQPKKTFYPKEYFHHININLPREIIYQNCNQRFNSMIRSGAIDEVKKLLQQNPNTNHTITKTIGFLEIKDYLQGNISDKQAIEIASKKTRNYAKRQLTWFRNQFQNIHQINVL